MATRGERLLAWLVNLVILILIFGIGYIIWWLIVAGKGQNPGKAIVGIRVIRTNGNAVRTGGMFVRGLAGVLCIFVPLSLDYLWILWDRDAQTLHDKLVNTVVVKAKGSEKIIEAGGLATSVPGFAPPPPYAPPVSFPTTPPPGTAPPTRQADEIFCHSCGRAVKADSQFCPSCGAAVAG